MSESQFMKTKDENDLFYKYVEKKSTITVIFTHGYGEYSKRYQLLYDYFLSKDYSCLMYDLRGHGNSSGVRGHVNDFNDYLDDLDVMVKFIKSKKPLDTIILGGHSLGGLITLLYSIKNSEKIDGVFLSSPYLKLAMRVPFIKKQASRVLSKILPSIKMKSGIDASKLNHDSQSVKDYLLDPMVHKVVTPRWFTETEKAQKEVEKKIKKLKIPLFFMQGGEDILASPKGGKKIFDKIEFGDKIYKLYPELYHEVLHEPQKLEIYSEINDWIIKLKR